MMKLESYVRVVNYYEGQMVSSGSIYSKNETIKLKKYEKK